MIDNVDLQTSLETFHREVAYHIAKRVEEVAVRYQKILEERDREISGLRDALKQSAKDFATLKEKSNGY